MTVSRGHLRRARESWSRRDQLDRRMGAALSLRADRHVAVTGAGASSWIDRATRLDFAQSTDAARPPLVVSASLGGQPALDFDGSADWLQVGSAASLPNVDGSTWFFALDADSVATANQNLLRGGVSALGGIVYHTNASLNVGLYDGTAHRGDTLAVTGPQTIALTLDAGALSARFRRNGELLGAALAYDGTLAINTSNALAVGGPPGGAAEWFNGRLAEVVGYARVLTPHEVGRKSSQDRRRYGIAFPWDPIHVSGLFSWQRADTKTLNGSNVSAWPDKGFSSHDFTQATAARQPAWLASDADVNNQPSITYDDVDDALVSDEAASTWSFLHDGTGCTIVFVVRPTTGGCILDTQVLLISRVGIEFGWNYHLADAMSVQLGNGSGVAVATQTIAHAVNTKAIVVCRHATAGSPQFDFRVNGVSSSAAYTGAPSTSAPQGTLQICGLTDSSSDTFGGELPELVTYNRYLNDAEVRRLETYLAARYAVALP